MQENAIAAATRLDFDTGQDPHKVLDGAQLHAARRNNQHGLVHRSLARVLRRGRLGAEDRAYKLPAHLKHQSAARGRGVHGPARGDPVEIQQVSQIQNVRVVGEERSYVRIVAPHNFPGGHGDVGEQRAPQRAAVEIIGCKAHDRHM